MTKHICIKCEHAVWPWFMPDCAKCKKHLMPNTEVQEPVTGKSTSSNDEYKYCMQVRGCWDHQIKRDGAPSPTCPDYEPRRRWWQRGRKA